MSVYLIEQNYLKSSQILYINIQAIFCLISVYWIIFNYKAQKDLAIPIIEIKIYANISNAIATYNWHNLS